MLDPVQIVGIGAAVASVSSFFPQAWKIVRTRNVKGLSRRMYFLTATAFTLWLAFGVLKREWALIVPNALCLIVTLFILAMLLMPTKTRSQVSAALDPATDR